MFHGGDQSWLDPAHAMAGAGANAWAGSGEKCQRFVRAMVQHSGQSKLDTTDRTKPPRRRLGDQQRLDAPGVRARGAAA